jgi:hypothetical protein
MVVDDRRKINVWVPGKLWEDIEKLGYESPTKATIAGFEALLSRDTLGSSPDAPEKEPEALGSSSVEPGKLGSWEAIPQETGKLTRKREHVT